MLARVPLALNVFWGTDGVRDAQTIHLVGQAALQPAFAPIENRSTLRSLPKLRCVTRD